MGSSGRGKFGNYDITNKSDTERGGEENHGCPSEILNINLEDVGTSEYYIKHNSVPKVGDATFLGTKLYEGRLVVILSSTNEVLGNLPTEYNFLLDCLSRELAYLGEVVGSGMSPIPFVVVTLHV